MPSSFNFYLEHGLPALIILHILKVGRGGMNHPELFQGCRGRRTFCHHAWVLDSVGPPGCQQSLAFLRAFCYTQGESHQFGQFQAGKIKYRFHI
jgi:hypothetical protein